MFYEIFSNQDDGNAEAYAQRAMMLGAQQSASTMRYLLDRIDQLEKRVAELEAERRK